MSRSILLGALGTLIPAAASAFCGFYIAGGDAKLFNNATQVVLMREGQRTVLSMQNNYEGPPEDFALVVPVPVVLQKDNVKVLPDDIFAKVDALDAPRLVEYWEQDPCYVPQYDDYGMEPEMSAVKESEDDSGGSAKRYKVKIEAQFDVGEYNIVILSAEDSTGLDAWLRDNKYKIPAGAEPILRPYVAVGMKFFVAKVNIAKAKRTANGVVLSPLRFHYDSTDFSLPIRLGLVNSAGTQDLIVHVLAPQQRYEVANYDNVTIPTNLEVSDATRQEFGAFYSALFDETVKAHPGAVVTEYSWDSSSCDPCPTPPLGDAELLTLGADVLGHKADEYGYYNLGFVLTRLHARYTKDTLGEDLVFRTAKPILGGRETGGPENNSRGAVEDSTNNFQGRYIIRHRWKGLVSCDNPQWGVWGGPPPGENALQLQAATNAAAAPRDQKLSRFVQADEAQKGLTAVIASAGTNVKPLPPGKSVPKRGACACTVGTRPAGAALLGAGLLFGLLLVVLRRRQA